MPFEVRTLADLAAVEHVARERGPLNGAPVDAGATHPDSPSAAPIAPLIIRPMSERFDLPDDDTKPLIEGLQYQGLTLFHAPPKRGKTFLVLQIIKSVITGKPLHDYFTVNQTGSVLYLSEMSEKQVRKRTKACGMTKQDHERLIFSAVWEMLPWAGGGAEQLEATVESMNPRPVLIVADSLLGIIKAMQAKGGSIAVQEYQLVDRFKRISERFSIPIIVVHHSRKLKGDAIESAMGTGAIPAACDDVWALARDSDHESVLTCDGREVEARTYRVKQGTDGFWELLESGGAAALGPARRAILKCITDTPGLEPTELAERLDMNPKTLGTHLRRLSDAGLVHRGRKGYVAVER